MNIDLGDELSRLARSVHDDATAERMTGQVHHMVGRIRRRRAARRTATSVVGVGAVAAVALGGAQLAGRTTTTPPATSPPASSPSATISPAPTAVEFGTCGSTVVDPTAGADPVVGLQATVGEVTLAAGAPTLDITLRLTGKIDVLTPEGLGSTRLVVARDGVVVGPVARPTMELESMPPVQVFAAPLVSCEDGAALPAGDYELYALQEGLDVPTDPSLTEVFGGPWPVTVGTDDVASPSPTSEPGQEGAIAAAQAALDDLLANPVPNPDYVFPACGTVAAEVLDDGMPPLELDLVDPELTLPAGSPYRSTVQLHTTLGRYVIGNASPNATLVILRDGVVVGYQWLDPEGLTDVDLADGQTQEFPVLGSMTLCLPDGSRAGPQHWLPPGEYRTMAALDVMLKEIGEPNGDAQSVSFTTTAVSEAGRLTVTWP